MIKRFQTLLLPLLGAGAIGVCPACWIGSASLLTYLGLGSLIPLWRQLAFAILFIAGIGFLLDYRSHGNFMPLILLILGSFLLYLGRYVYGGSGFGGWPIWGLGALIIVAAVIYNRHLFKEKKHSMHGKV